MMAEETETGSSRWCPPELPIILGQQAHHGKTLKPKPTAVELCSAAAQGSSFVKLAPSALRFPYNSQRHHNQRLTLWNQTPHTLKVRLKSPDAEIFLIHVDGKLPGPLHEVILYGHKAKIVSIECHPGRHKMAKSSLKIHMHSSSESHECLELPLEIYPSTAWFNLPKIIVMPDVIVGRKAHAIITLPHPQHAEKFFVSFKPSFTPHDAITLTPMTGTIGGKQGIRQLKITYAPTDYTTVSCVIKVHFPGLSSTSPHEIRIFGRCRPGKEADEIRKEIKEIETFRPKPLKKKKKYPRIKFRRLLSPSTIDQITSRGLGGAEQMMSNLFTSAGVMHFMLRKRVSEAYQSESKRPTGIEVLANQLELQHHEKLKLYHEIKKKFGLDFEEMITTGDDHSSLGSRVRKLKTFQKKDWEEIQRLVGLPLFGRMERISEYVQCEIPGDDHFHLPGFCRAKSAAMRKSHFPGSQQRKTWKARGSYSSTQSSRSRQKAQKSIAEEEKKAYRNMSAMDEAPKDLTPKQKFIQLALIVITRWRADQRIAKLRVLIEETKRSRGSGRKPSTVKRKSSTAGKNGKSVQDIHADSKGEHGIINHHHNHEPDQRKTLRFSKRFLPKESGDAT